MKKLISDSQIASVHPGALASAIRAAGLRPVSSFELGRTKRLRRGNPAVGGIEEVITQPMYDSFSIAANTAVTKQVMFQTPIGQGNKTLAQTNMTKAGVLENPQKLDIRAIRLYVSNNANPTDALNFLLNCSFTFTVGKKPMLEVPCLWIPSGMGVNYFGAQVGTAAAGSNIVYHASNGLTDPRAVFTLSQPIVIEGGEGFSVTINPETAFNTVAAASVPAGTGITVYVFLDGELYRQVQ